MKVCVKPQGLRFTFSKNIYPVFEKCHERGQEEKAKLPFALHCTRLHVYDDNVCLR